LYIPQLNLIKNFYNLKLIRLSSPIETKFNTSQLNDSKLHFFYKNKRLIFAQNVKTIPASAEEHLKLSVKVVNKTAASTAKY